GLTQPLSSKDLVEAEEWAQQLGIPDFQDRAKQLLAAQEQNNRVRELLELSTIYGLRLFEQTGLDNVGVGGEQQRVEMYEHVIRGVEGMRVLGHVQSFDYKYFNKAVAESKIHRKHPIYLQEFFDVKKNAKGQLKVPITGPYTLVDWSFSGHYSGGRTSLSLKKQKQEAKREFLLDFVEQVIRPEIRDLVYFIQNGYDGEFGVGVVHVHDFSGHVPSGSGKEAGRNILESPELVRDRLLYAAKVVGDPAKIWANPDCGLRTRTWEVTLAKLISTVKGAELAREASL